MSADEGSSNNDASVSVAVVIVLIVLVCGAVAVWWRRRRKRGSSASESQKFHKASNNISNTGNIIVNATQAQPANTEALAVAAQGQSAVEEYSAVEDPPVYTKLQSPNATPRESMTASMEQEEYVEVNDPPVYLNVHTATPAGAKGPTSAGSQSTV